MSSAATVTPIKTIRFVPLRDLIIDHEHWTNPRTVTGLEDEDIAELAADIKARGIQVPLIVQKILVSKGTDKFTNLVIEGQRRDLAAQEVLSKDALIPVVDRTVDPIDPTPEAMDALMLDMLAVGTHREGLSSYELSEVAERLVKRGKKHEEIGKAIGRDASWVSKILKARKAASPELMKQWRKGNVTDEQLKEIAEAVADPVKQAEATKEIVELRKSGDKAEARVRAKEILAEAKNGKKAAPAPHTINSNRTSDPTINKGTNGVSPVVRGPQADIFEKSSGASTKNEPATPPAPKMRSRAVLDDLLFMTTKRPPTSDIVKGIMMGVQYAAGLIEADDFGKAWDQYVARVDGKPRPKKAKAKAKAAKKASAKKPAKKKASKKGGRK